MNSRRADRREVATKFVRAVNAKTLCASCGGGPIEWHGEHHPTYPNARISSLRTQGASVDRIKEEMALCEPLCRSCHMQHDGRLANLSGGHAKGVVLVPPLPCSCCSKLAKPRRRGLCSGCYNHRSGLRPRAQPTCGCLAFDSKAKPTP